MNKTFTALLCLVLLQAFPTALKAEDKPKNFPFSATEDSDGSRYVWFVYGKSGMAYPYLLTSDIPKSDRFKELNGEVADPGIIIWWPNYMGLFARDKSGRPVIYGAQRTYAVGELDARFGKPRFFTFVKPSEPKTTPGETELNWAEEKIEYFARYAAYYPPDVSGEEELDKVRREWRQIEKEFVTLVKNFPDSYEVRLRAGNFYRYGHNLDVGGFDESRESLYRAITLSPWSSAPYLSLATLFYTSDPDKARSAELLLNEAMKVDDSEETAKKAIPGLYFATYYQGDVKSALAYAEEYLRRWPGDRQMENLRDSAKEMLERKEKEKLQKLQPQKEK